MKIQNTQPVKKKSILKRFAATFLALLIAVMCMPSSLFEASAFGFGYGFGFGWGPGWGAPNVLTNATVKFKDGNTVIGSVDSGNPFSIVVTISGNNVYQNFGSNSTKYRIEITDSNLLLTNFKGNGFTNGAKNNGYILVVEPDGNRYIKFSIRNGSTKTIQLSAK